MQIVHFVSEPIRENSTVDLVITNRDNLVSNVKMGEKLDSSEHQEIRFKIKWDIKILPNQVQVPDFRRANYELRKYLGQVCQVRSWKGMAQVGSIERSNQQRGVNPRGD